MLGLRWKWKVDLAGQPDSFDGGARNYEDEAIVYLT